ncbi:Rossman fold protein, TIGR00730 family [Candidatus Roizmanbacteria bacterium RIFCSPLOWO2_01_FULL_37_16]|uniref:Cytokinin riboside 5'-monophosphate phosphoribohydrolase n=1 Tax=Candidatus Roizmanbacteria bacterium RIFCSPLOWO2_01_FULL_37_16 TaxID=1802058 RepID=A0A1F7ILA0_9BACT|nr:MAG: Rossman fold protein, TIGR00730 family [Candidatus Roizmanbacteria bacterium RIFCSPLOWO2_01_FULL_37_16]
MKTIGVFCSANEVDKKYVNATVKLAKLIVENGYDLVWGGTNKGLMKVIADEVQHKGGKVIGITVEFLKQGRRMNADEMIITKDISDRKSLFFNRSNAIILLVGGIGSLDEVSELLELKKHNFHNHPVVVLNTDNFYAGLKAQLQRMEKDGFLTKELKELIYFAETPKQAIQYINSSRKKKG